MKEVAILYSSRYLSIRTRRLEKAIKALLSSRNPLFIKVPIYPVIRYINK